MNITEEIKILVENNVFYGKDTLSSNLDKIQKYGAINYLFLVYTHGMRLFPVNHLYAKNETSLLAINYINDHKEERPKLFKISVEDVKGDRITGEIKELNLPNVCKILNSKAKDPKGIQFYYLCDNILNSKQITCSSFDNAVLDFYRSFEGKIPQVEKYNFIYNEKTS